MVWPRAGRKRIEGFCSERDWLRAYSEINDFEHELSAAGAIVIKFWLQISQAEQLTRFKAREETPFQALQDHRGRLAQPRKVAAISASRFRHGRAHQHGGGAVDTG
jgi:hypothetical protein